MFINNKSWRRRTRMRCRVQQLYEACLHVFKAPATVPSPTHVHHLCSILDKMKREDVGLSKDLPFFNTNATKSTAKATPRRVTCSTIYHSNHFMICIFFLPASAVIPLHNHPGMTVFSKLLFGSMHIKSYDYISDRSNQYSVVTSPCKTSVLYPTTGGNIHEFRGITGCAVLDVMAPPYSQHHGRDCSYFKLSPSTNYGEDVKKEKGYAWLEEIEAPEQSMMDMIQYLGPQILEIST